MITQAIITQRTIIHTKKKKLRIFCSLSMKLKIILIKKRKSESRASTQITSNITKSKKYAPD